MVQARDGGAWCRGLVVEMERSDGFHGDLGD